MNYSIEFTLALAFVFIASLLWIAAKVLKISVPVVYGRHETGQSRFRVPTRLSWVLMESPACLVFTYFVFTGPLPVTAPVIALLIMWQMHYFHRAFIYPFQLQIRAGSTTPLNMTLFGAIVTTACGYLNGEFISRYAVHLQSNDWFYSPAFIIGTMLFLIGFVLNKASDSELIKLRKQNPDNYSIPYNGAYRWVSCPNYLGELITWFGFSLAAWSIAGFTFALMSAANLTVRALENHRWYHEKFPDYPPERKAIIPFVL
jgi:3-oxo-5-alpha-steroid 4-dehydrogenase 1